MPCPRRWTNKVPKFARESYHHWAATHTIPASSRRRSSRPQHLAFDRLAPLNNQTVSFVFIVILRIRSSPGRLASRPYIPASCPLLPALHSVPATGLRPSTSLVSSNA